ncbi:hypothetical protein ACMGGR_02245 [Erwinia sp. BNK-24-b]|uniref:hypothetical protein n=1 Tax=unclassified Erwinia TaxID=2622719 RepID=UPI0039BFA3FA
MYERLLAIKEENHSTNPDIGLVIPIAHYNEDGSLSDIDSSDFPNGAIFVSKGFLNIDQLFKNDEIFILNEYFDRGEEDWKNNSRLQKHYTLGSKADKIDRHLFIPVLNISLPDKASGFIDYPYEIPNNLFFIENGDFVYGPFKATKQNDSWLLTPLTTPSPLQLNTDFVAKIEKNKLIENNLLENIRIKGTVKSFIRNLKDISAIHFQQIDYISDVKLINYFTRNNFGKGKNNLLGKTEAQRLSQGIEDYAKKNKAMSNNERFDRLRNLLSEFLDKSDYGSEIINEFLAETRDGRIYLDTYFANNRDQLLKEKNEELEKSFQSKKEVLENDLKEIEKHILAKKEELTNSIKEIEIEKIKAQLRIEDIKKQSDEDAHTELLKKQKELTEQNSKIEKSIIENKKIVDGFNLAHEQINEFNTLDKEIEYLKRRKQEIETDNRLIENALKTQEAMLESSQLPDKLAEISALTSILRGEKRKSVRKEPATFKINCSEIELDKENRADYINYLTQVFSSDGGRNFTPDEIANLVICMSQSFMTILSGPPGTGKTSTVIRMAKHMQLTDDDIKSHNTNFLNIAVGRAWVSGRDILGFYNSLKDTYQPSRTGLYDFLRNEKNNDFLKMVLLDEANLSSMEHYWSDFLGMCDPEGVNRLIDTGIPEQSERYFSIPSNLRFLSTINNDSTTEKLSPRLIDRVPVITMAHNNNYKTIPTQSLDFAGALPFESMDNAFNISSSEASFNQEEETALESIINILSRPLNRTSSVNISQRKVNAIRRYCHTANEIGMMRAAPLDYAINQHILPLIEGYGSSFKERLTDLEQQLSEYGFTLSKSTLTNIINHGDIYGDSYSYF